MQRPPAGGFGRGAPCRGGSEYTVTICSVTVPLSFHYLAIGLGVAIVITIVLYVL
jgi:hypothetical protein